MYKRRNSNPIVGFVALVICLIVTVMNVISVNRGISEYNSMKEYCQVIEGRITGINMESKRSRVGTRTRYNTYLRAIVVYTEDGEEQSQEFYFPLFKRTGDSVKLARLPDGSLVPLYIQLPGNVNTMIALGVFLLLGGAVLWRMKLNPKAVSSVNPVKLVEDDFDRFATREEKMLKIVNNQAQTINTNEEVEISEEPETVIPLGKRGSGQDSFYSTEDPGEYEGINLDDLIVERLDD